MSPRKRSQENRGLPKRWQLYHGAYYYRVPPGQEHQWDNKKRFLLGKTLPEAYKAWAERMQTPDAVRTVGGLLDRYALEEAPTKAPKTQAEYARHIKRLSSVFGSMPLTAIRPQHVYLYVDKRKDKKGRKVTTAAHREIEVLSHAYTKAVEWGLLDRHPFKSEVLLKGEKARTRYVEDWEVIEALSLSSRRKRGSVIAIQAYIRIKLVTGLRRSDLLRLRVQDLREDGIHVQPHKTANTTGKRLIIEWTPDLHKAVDEAKAARPVDISPWLFCNRRGQCYINEAKGTANGWDSMWQRFMERVLSDTKVTERFTEHDLRAKCASDADSLEHAQQLLAHADARLTARVYRRKPERVKPGKGV